MPRSRGFPGDIIPAHGEARVLAELKGGYGKKPKGYMNYRKGGKGRINYLRSARSVVTRKAMEAVPLAPGPFAANVTGQRDRVSPYNGHLGTTIQYKWLFALTPELHDYAGQDEPPLWRGPGQNDGKEWADRLRIVGFKGDLLFTPQIPLAGSPFPEAFSGLMGIGLAKFKATIVGAANQEVSYPWGLFSEATAYFSGAGSNIGLGPHSESTFTDADELYARDLRTRRGRDVMWHRTLRWEIPIATNTIVDTVPFIGTGAPRSYRLPLPRKMLADVGQGEAIGVWFWCKDFGSSAEDSGSPVGRFDFPDLRVLYRELDG